MMFKATLNNITFISCFISFIGEVPGEYHRPVASYCIFTSFALLCYEAVK